MKITEIRIYSESFGSIRFLFNRVPTRAEIIDRIKFNWADAPEPAINHLIQKIKLGEYQVNEDEVYQLE